MEKRKVKITKIKDNYYFTSDEEIKKGDYILSTKTNNIFKADSIEYKNSHNMIEDFDKSFYINSKTARKIVATTDESLHKKDCSCEGTGYDGRKRCMNCNGLGFLYNIAQIPQQFIEEYVKAGGIDEVYLEYEKESYSNRFNSVDETGIKKTWGTDLQIKLDQNNCVIIHLIKSTFSYDAITHAIAYGHSMAKQGMSHHQTLINYKDANNIIYKSSEPILYTSEDLIGNQDGSLDEYLLNSSKYTQEERELIMDAVNNWITENL